MQDTIQNSINISSPSPPTIHATGRTCGGLHHCACPMFGGSAPAAVVIKPKPSNTKKDQVTTMITTMRGLMSGNALSQETLDLLDVGFNKLIETEDVNGTQAVLTKGAAMYASGKYKSMNDVVKDKEFSSLIAKYGVDTKASLTTLSRPSCRESALDAVACDLLFMLTCAILTTSSQSKALTKSINNPFKMIDGKQTLDFEAVLGALNLTAGMTKTLSDFMASNTKVMDAAKAKAAEEGKGKWLTKYGTLNMNKLMQDADVAAALADYVTKNPTAAKDVAELKTAVAASTAADEAAGAALDPVVTDDSSASTTAAGVVTVAAAVFMAL